MMERIKQEILAELRPELNDDHNFESLKERIRNELLWELEPWPASGQGYKYRNDSSFYRKGWQHRLSTLINNGPIKGVLYGLGTAVLAGLVLPSAGRKLRNLSVHTVEESMDLVDRARSMVVRAKEGVEDIIAEASFNRFQAEFLDDRSQAGAADFDDYSGH